MPTLSQRAAVQSRKSLKRRARLPSALWRGRRLPEITALFAGLLPEEKKLDANGNEYVTLVLSLGGGALTGSETAQVIKENTMCVYLKCSVDLLLQRLADGHSERPLIMHKSREELREYIASTLALRNPSYIGNSRIIVECDGKSAADICNEIIGHLE